MHKLRSPFIVGFVGASYVPGKLCVLTEFMEKGSVARILIPSFSSTSTFFDYFFFVVK